jgi:hypothetical protein
VKAINNLTQALKERRNKKGTEQIEALKKLDELLNKVPATITSPQPPQAITENRQVTFAATSKPPQETQPPQRETKERPTYSIQLLLVTVQQKPWEACWATFTRHRPYPRTWQLQSSQLL